MSVILKWTVLFLLLNIKGGMYVEIVCVRDLEMSISGFMGIETLRQEKQWSETV